MHAYCWAAVRNDIFSAALNISATTNGVCTLSHTAYHWPHELHNILNITALLSNENISSPCLRNDHFFGTKIIKYQLSILNKHFPNENDSESYVGWRKGTKETQPISYYLILTRRKS